MKDSSTLHIYTALTYGVLRASMLGVDILIRAALLLLSVLGPFGKNSCLATQSHGKMKKWNPNSGSHTLLGQTKGTLPWIYVLDFCRGLGMSYLVPERLHDRMEASNTENTQTLQRYCKDSQRTIHTAGPSTYKMCIHTYICMYAHIYVHACESHVNAQKYLYVYIYVYEFIFI